MIKFVKVVKFVRAVGHDFFGTSPSPLGRKLFKRNQLATLEETQHPIEFICAEVAVKRLCQDVFATESFGIALLERGEEGISDWITHTRAKNVGHTRLYVLPQGKRSIEVLRPYGGSPIEQGIEHAETKHLSFSAGE